MWSIAGGILGGNNGRTLPLLMKTMLFLCENRKFWDMEIIQETYQKTCSDRTRNNMKDDRDFEEHIDIKCSYLEYLIYFQVIE